MQKVLFLILTCTLILAAQTKPAAKTAAKPAAKPAASYDQDVRTLLKLTEVDASGKAMVEQIGMMMKMGNPQIPDTVIINLMKKVNTAGFTNAVVPIYKKYFTHPEVKEMIKFYTSPVGKKMSKSLPGITRDAMMGTQGWAEGEARKMKSALEAKGYKFPTAPAGAPRK